MRIALKVLNKSNEVKGFVLYEGPSLFDGKPIVVVVTLKSDNEKTGNMVQTWIMRSDMPPTEILKLKLDYSVCFKCRFSNGNGCYVNLGQGPLAIWNAYKNGSYLNFNDNKTKALELLKNRSVRIGSYGDPTAIPVDYWLILLGYCNGTNTGYTHNWKNCTDKIHFKNFLMASCDSENEAIEAQSLGWKTFTVFNPNMELPTNIGINCVNETHGKQCIDCKLCNGNKANIVIKLHGLSYKVKRAISVLPM